MSIDKGMDEGDVARTCGGISLSHKKQQNHSVCKDMDGPRTVVQSEEKHRIVSPIGGCRKMVRVNLFAKQRERQM